MTSPRPTARPDIQIHIERLVLDGISVTSGERPTLQVALVAELSRLVAEGGLAPGLDAGGAVLRVAAADIQVAPRNPPAYLGRQIARSIYGGIGDA